MPFVCPICRGDQFVAQGKREHARCVQCQSLERGRLFWMVANRISLFSEAADVMHIAPERWIVNTELPRKSGYKAFDIDTERYRRFPIPVAKMDLCKDLAGIATNSFDVIVHHHVLEHLPCQLRPVLGEFSRILKPGGVMAFSLPIRQNVGTIEDLNPALTGEERTARFGQHNHMRSLGTNDAVEILEGGLGGPIAIGGQGMFEEEELVQASIPPTATRKFTSHTTILFKKAA